MKNSTLLVALIFLVSSISTAKAPIAAEPCKNEIVKVKKLLGDSGAKTKVTPENYKKAIEALNRSFTSPKKAELDKITKSLEKKPKKTPKALLDRNKNSSCRDAQLDLTNGLNSFAKTQKTDPAVRTEVWEGLSKYYQANRYNLLLEVTTLTSQFQKTLKVFKPEDKALAKELDLLKSEAKQAAKAFSQGSKDLSFEDMNALTPEHYPFLLQEDQDARRMLELFKDIVKSTKI